ncbi:MAG: VOC family protein, partial [Rhabdochlamydiaceae bacterium]
PVPMKTLSPYITFDGNCREAMEFYHGCLGGELRFQTVDESPLSANLPPAMQKLIVHAILIQKDFILMGSDMIDDNGLIKGNGVSMVLGCDDEKEARNCYKRLSEGGHQTHPLTVSHWGALLGGLMDRYGNYWVLSYLKKRQ